MAVSVFRKKNQRALSPEAKPVLLAKRAPKRAKLTPSEFIEKNSIYLNGFADTVRTLLDRKNTRRKLEELVGDNERVQVIIRFNRNGFPKCTSAEITDLRGNVVKDKLPKKMRRRIINGVNKNRRRLYRLRHKDTKRKIRLSEPFEQPIRVKLPK